MWHPTATSPPLGPFPCRSRGPTHLALISLPGLLLSVQCLSFLLCFSLVLLTNRQQFSPFQEREPLARKNGRLTVLCYYSEPSRYLRNCFTTRGGKLKDSFNERSAGIRRRWSVLGHPWEDGSRGPGAAGLPLGARLSPSPPGPRALGPPPPVPAASRAPPRGLQCAGSARSWGPSAPRTKGLVSRRPGQAFSCPPPSGLGQVPAGKTRW